MKKLMLLVVGAAVALSGLTVFRGDTVAFATHTTIAWMGQTWEISDNATAAIDGAGNVVLTRTTGTADATLHINRVLPAPAGASFINANGTPWIQYSYIDNGAFRGVDIFIDDETLALDPRLQAGSLFNCQGLGYARYNLPAIEEIVFGEGAGCGTAPGVGARAAGQKHTIYVGQRTDGTIDYNYDGKWFTSTFLKDNVGPFDFNDVYLRLRGTSGATATFTDFKYGDNHVAPITDKDGCKNGGWATSVIPTFKNQGDCVSHFATDGKR
ncbi:MAG: hypothetical protein HYX51_02110 [Chloroflexi bacterium]|nr:hypothetical protein [Chloroflexota bacterium]